MAYRWSWLQEASKLSVGGHIDFRQLSGTIEEPGEEGRRASEIARGAKQGLECPRENFYCQLPNTRRSLFWRQIQQVSVASRHSESASQRVGRVLTRALKPATDYGAGSLAAEKICLTGCRYSLSYGKPGKTPMESVCLQVHDHGHCCDGTHIAFESGARIIRTECTATAVAIALG